MHFCIFEKAMKSARGLNRRDFCGAAAAAAAAEPISFLRLSFFTKEHSYECKCTAKGQRCYSSSARFM